MKKMILWVQEKIQRKDGIVGLGVKKVWKHY